MERRVALVIGVGQYSQAPHLVNPVNDASRMTAVLKRLGFDVMAGLDVIHDDMEKIITAFEKSIEDAGRSRGADSRRKLSPPQGRSD